MKTAGEDALQTPAKRRRSIRERTPKQVQAVLSERKKRFSMGIPRKEMTPGQLLRALSRSAPRDLTPRLRSSPSYAQCPIFRLRHRARQIRHHQREHPTLRSAHQVFVAAPTFLAILPWRQYSSTLLPLLSIHSPLTNTLRILQTFQPTPPSRPPPARPHRPPKSPKPSSARNACRGRSRSSADPSALARRLVPIGQCRGAIAWLRSLRLSRRDERACSRRT